MLLYKSYLSIQFFQLLSLSSFVLDQAYVSAVEKKNDPFKWGVATAAFQIEGMVFISSFYFRNPSFVLTFLL